MRTLFTLKSLRDLTSDAVHVEEESARSILQSSQQTHDPPSERFREELQRRYTTPFVSAISYHRWGLNE